MIPQSQEIFVAEKQIKITWLRGTISKKNTGEYWRWIEIDPL